MALYVSAEELKNVAKDLLNKKETIQNVYDSKIKGILEESKEAIVASGVNFDDFKSTFAQVFNRVGTKLEALSHALTNEIIPKYEGLGSSISNSFNNEFANEMNSLLNKIKE